MFDSCLYHIIDSLVPPSVEENMRIQNSLMRLENICALAIVYHRNTGAPMTRTRTKCYENALSSLPPHLHKVLLKAYLLHKFYITQYSSATLDECTFDELPQLLYNWPYEEFNLKKLMPRLPPRLELFTSVPEEEYVFRSVVQENVEHIGSFRYALINEIIDFYINFHKNCSPEQEKVLKIRTIDITGFESHIRNIIEVIDMMETINTICKFVIIVDTEINIDEGSSLPSFYISLFDSDFIKVNHVTAEVTSFEAASEVKKSIRRIVKNGTISINVRYRYDNTLDNSGLLEQIYDGDTWGSNVLSVKLVGCASNMNFLQYLDNLVHLDLRFNNLHGRLSCLTNMSRALLYMNLCYCKLTNSDLYNIKVSCHVSKLKELDLSGNDLSYDDDCINLIELCQNLSNLRKLRIVRCKLGTWSNNCMSLLFDSIRNMPNVVDISMCDNEFSIDNIHEHIMKLRENISLRYLCIELPTQVTKSNRKIFSDGIKEKMNMSRPDLLWVVVV